MTKRKRITILGVCLAAGVGLAVAWAMSTRPPPAPATPAAAQLTATARVAANAEPPAPPAAADSSASHESGAASFVPLAQLTGAQAAYRVVTQQLESLESSFDHFRHSQDRRQRDITDALADLQDKVDGPGSDELPPADAAAAAQPAAEPLPPAIERTDEGKLRVSMEDADVRDALKLLSHVANFDIMASKNVSGSVTASLRDVDLDTALAAILKSAGLVARDENGIV